MSSSGCSPCLSSCGLRARCNGEVHCSIAFAQLAKLVSMAVRCSAHDWPNLSVWQYVARPTIGRNCQYGSTLLSPRLAKLVSMAVRCSAHDWPKLSVWQYVAQPTIGQNCQYGSTLLSPRLAKNCQYGSTLLSPRLDKNCQYGSTLLSPCLCSYDCGREERAGCATLQLCTSTMAAMAIIIYFGNYLIY